MTIEIAQVERPRFGRANIGRPQTMAEQREAEAVALEARRLAVARSIAAWTEVEKIAFLRGSIEAAEAFAAEGG